VVYFLVPADVSVVGAFLLSPTHCSLLAGSARCSSLPAVHSRVVGVAVETARQCLAQMVLGPAKYALTALPVCLAPMTEKSLKLWRGNSTWLRLR